MKRIISLVLAMLVLAVVAMPVFAADSPQENQEFTVDVSSNNASRGTVTKTLNADGTVTLTATPITNEFTEWVITGEYELASGKLTDKTIVVKLSSNATAVAKFDGKAIGGSPQTGTSAVPALMLVSLISAGVALYSCKRLCR